MTKGGRWNRACWLVAIPLIYLPATATGIGPPAVSFRAGTSAAWTPQQYHQQTLGLRFQLPWESLQSGWRIASHLDLEVSRISEHDESAWLYSAGPSVTLSRNRFIVDLGVLPSYISQDHLGGRQFGGPLQFTSHIGLSYQFNRHMRLGYRLQHTSNANIYDVNEGLDLQAIELWLGF
jgi:hypothetical protein